MPEPRQPTPQTPHDPPKGEATVAEMKASRTHTPWLRWLVDGAPTVAFLIVLLISHDFRLATMWLVGAAASALLLGLVMERRIARLPAITGGLAIVFGGASLLLHSPDILKMKMTIVDTALGAVLFGGLALKKNPLKYILGGAFALPDRAWTVLAVRYGLFWWACAVANEVVRRTQKDAIWAEFRVVVIALAVVFALAQTPFLLKHAKAAAELPTPEPPEPGF
jgi:intracellular septation protein